MAAIVLALAISALVPLVIAVSLYIMTIGSAVLQPRLTALIMVNILGVVLGISLAKGACDRLVREYSAKAVFVFFCLLFFGDLAAHADLSANFNWHMFQLVVGNVTMIVASAFVFLPSPSAKVKRGTADGWNKVVTRPFMTKPPNNRTVDGNSGTTAMHGIFVKITTPAVQKLMNIAVTLTFVLNILDTWQGTQSVLVKLLFSLTLDAFLAVIWPITWMLWVDAAWSGHRTPLSFLFGRDASWIIWIVIPVVVVPLWFIMSAAVFHLIPARVLGRATLKGEARKAGVEIALIPDAAWDELVERHIKVAKFAAEFSHKPENRNWRASLVQDLEIEARILSAVMRGQRVVRPIDEIYEPTLATMKKFGVIKE